MLKINTHLEWSSINTKGVTFNTGVFAVMDRAYTHEMGVKCLF